MEHLLHLAIDQHSGSLIRTPEGTLTTKMFIFGSKSVTLSMKIDAGEVLYWFDCIN